jgi:hypothetical protein
MNLRTFMLVTCLMFTANSFADANDKPRFEQLSWLSGCWKGTGLGGEVGECWMPSADEKLTGVFQMTKDGQLQFSEIVMIAQFDGNFGMRVKHFDPSFNQWAKDKGVGHTFTYVEMGENYIQFEGLRYELINDTLHVTLDMKKGDETQQVSFFLHRELRNQD